MELVKSFLAKLSLMTFGVGLALGIGEFCVRAGALTQDANKYIFDETLGHRRPPDIKGHYETTEFRTSVEFNSAGYRDKARSRLKPKDNLRIAVLGDSYMEGLQVDFSEVFSQQLERALLLHAPSTSIEVLNFGVSGYGTTQEYLQIPEILSYQPNVVVLAFLTGNDVRNNNILLDQKTNDYGLAQRPYLELDNNGAHFHSPGPEAKRAFERTGWRYLLFDSSKLIQTVHSRMRQNTGVAKIMVNLGFLSASTFHLMHGIPTDYQIYSMQPAPEWQQAWGSTKYLLASMHSELREAGVPLVVVSLTNREQIYKTDWQAILRQYPLMNSQTWDLELPSNKLSAILQELGIPEIRLLEKFRRYAEAPESARLHYELDGHWTKVGHRLGAEIVASELWQHNYLGIAR